MWRRKRRNELEDVNLLEVTPVRTADWIERGERVVVIRPQPERPGLRGLVDRLLFLLSAAVTLGIAFLTVSYRAVKAGRTNPAEALKYE